MLKRSLVLATVLVLLLTVVSAVSAQVTVDFLNFSSSGENEKHLARMKEIFEEQNPNIKINVQTIGYDDYFTRLMTSIVGATAPDAFELNYENFTAYATRGALKPLDELIAETNVDMSVMDESALNAFVSDGVQYGLPYSFSNVVVLYNKELFDQASVDYPTKDWTWDEQLEAAKKIRALGEDIFGIFQPLQFWEFYKIVGQNGGSLMNEAKTEFTINSPQNVETLEYFVSRILEHNVVPTEEQLSGMGDWDLFAAGRVGMLVTGIWAFPFMTENCDFEWDIAVEPGNTSKSTHFFANGLVVNKDAKHPEEAFKWINFLTSGKEMAEARVKSGWELPATTYPEILELYSATTPPENKQAVFDSLEYLVVPPVIEQFGELQDIVGRYLDEAKSGFMSPQEALDNAQREVETRIKL